MAKQYIDKTVYEATLDRIKYLFEEFDNVLIAFSGGKDSSVCLHMVYDYAKEHGLLEKVAMYHLDYEAQYQMTTDYVTEAFNIFPGIKKYWLCLPVGAQCACRMDGGTWIPWEKEKQDIWVRQMPDSEYLITEENCPMKFKVGQQDYDVQDKFVEWFETQHGKTANIIGIRADESLSRYGAVSSTNKNPEKYKGQQWINGHKAYPIYDWTVEDVWTYFGKYGKSYNHLYDLYYQAGLTLDQMRVASPFNDCAMDTLKLYKVIDPTNWGKMIGRVNGVNFAGIYGGTTAMGWKSIKKPEHFTWKEYCYFLLDTLDEKTREHYLAKLNTSLKFWKEKGGCISDETIAEMDADGVEYIDKGYTSNYSSDKKVIAFEDYLDDTNCTNFRELPTYKRMCVCIIKNDYFCKYMGFSQTKAETEKRKRAMEKYKNL